MKVQSAASLELQLRDAPYQSESLLHVKDSGVSKKEQDEEKLTESHEIYGKTLKQMHKKLMQFGFAAMRIFRIELHWACLGK